MEVFVGLFHHVDVRRRGKPEVDMEASSFIDSQIVCVIFQDVSC